MDHRHLDHNGYTLAAIDDIIERGNATEWVELRNEVLSVPSVASVIRRLLAQKPIDLSDQRTMFWRFYVGHYVA